MKNCYIGIDLGGTFIKYGLVGETGEILARGKTATPSGCGYAETIGAIAAAVREIAPPAAACVRAAGIGSPGVIDGEDGIVVTSGNLGWEEKPLASDLSQILGMPVVLTNDANAAAWGEYACGAGKQYRSVVLLTLGTGVGSGIVLDGRLFEGTRGAGAELGHETICLDGVPCSCGRRGCFEAYASASALIRQTKEAMEHDRSSLMWELCGGEIAHVNGKTAFDGLRAEDRAARKVVTAYVRYLAEGIANVVNAFRPEAVLLGGGLSAEGETLTVPLQEQTDALILGHGRYAPVKILTARLGNDAGLIGAAMLAKQKESK